LNAQKKREKFVLENPKGKGKNVNEEANVDRLFGEQRLELLEPPKLDAEGQVLGGYPKNSDDYPNTGKSSQHVQEQSGSAK
jgi:hypothetical protein